MDVEYVDEELMYEWCIFFYYNDYFYFDFVDFEYFSFVFISLLGCQEEFYWYCIQLIVIDFVGFKILVMQQLYFYCGDLFLEWNELVGVVVEGGVNLMWDI